MSAKIKITNYKFSDVDTHIVAVGKSATSLKVKIHSLAITILAHWANNPKDGALCAEKMTALMVASPYHSKAFSEWVALMTGMHWSKETEVFYVQKGQKLKKDKLDAAKNEPFWEVSPPPKPQPLTDEAVLKMLEGILAKQVKHEKKPVEGDNFSKKANESIRAAITALKGE